MNGEKLLFIAVAGPAGYGRVE